MKHISPRKLILFLLDIFCILLAVSAVIWTGSYQPTLLEFFALVGIITLCRVIFSTYSGIWRYANTNDYIRLMIADAVATVAIFAVKYIFRFALPITFILATCFGGLLLVLAGRLVYRYLKTDRLEKFEHNKKKKIPVAVVGAGYAGMLLAEEFRRDANGKYFVYCFLDKDRSKIGSRINGVRVLGSDEAADVILRGTAVKDIIIAAPSLSLQRKRELADLYISKGYQVKMYEPPLNRTGIGDMGDVHQHLRQVKIGDLLERDQIQLDTSAVNRLVTDKVVLVTGGGGSIGSELCRQIASMNPKRLVIVDIYENNAYEIQQELIRRYGANLCLSVEIASVRDRAKMDLIFAKYRPTLVFHAAAHKHVPLMENASDEAVKNNVFGTYNVASVAEKYGVEKMILISTDKAVNPTNVMGASKRFCEMIIQSKKESKTVFAAVRFGNVLGSNGSVIPLFQKQIENGGPVTITDKRITRYFMTIPEAVQLVLQAGALAKNAEIFVLDMGKPVRILDLAENMVRLAGYKPYEDMDIVEIGLRPGEKLYEELLMKTEELDKTSVEKIYIEKEKGISQEEIEEKLASVRTALETQDEKQVKAELKKLIPTYKSPEEVNGF